MSTDLMFWFIPLASVLALGFALYFFKQLMKLDEGTDSMKRIALYVRRGAMSYLKQQYKIVTIVFILMAIFFSILAYVAKVQNGWVPFAFLTGGFHT